MTARIVPTTLFTMLLFPAVLPKALSQSPQSSSSTTQKGCASSRQQAEGQVARLQQALSQDVRALKNLNPAFGTDVASIEDWYNLADKAKEEQNKEALDLLKDLTLDAVLKAFKYAADTKLAVYPINSDDFIAKYNITAPGAKDLVNKLALLNVNDPLWFNHVETIIKGTKSSYSIATAKALPDATTAKDWADYASVVLGAVPLFFKSTSLNANPVLKDAGLWLSTSRLALAEVVDIVTGRVSLSKIDALSKLTATQLQALKAITDLMERHLQALKGAKASLAALPSCQNDITWQLTLQKQRLAAISSGLLSEYNRLQQAHFAIYRNLGLQPCQSGAFPSGCTTRQEYSQTLKTTVTTITSCVPPAANNLIEATQIEASSTHDGCYSRDAQGNLFFTSNAGPSSYKPVLSTPTPDATFTLPPAVISSPIAGADVTFERFQGPNTTDPSLRFEASGQGAAITVHWSGVGEQTFSLDSKSDPSERNDGRMSTDKSTTQFVGLKPGRYVLSPNQTVRAHGPYYDFQDAVIAAAKIIGYSPEYQIEVRAGMTTHVTPPAACMSFEWKGQAGIRITPVDPDGVERSPSRFMPGQQGINRNLPSTLCAPQGKFLLKISSMACNSVNGNGYPLIPVELRWGYHTRVAFRQPATGEYSDSAYNEVRVTDRTGKVVCDEHAGQKLFDVLPGTYFLESPSNKFQRKQMEFKAGEVNIVAPPVAASPGSLRKKK
jgi:hypothetical protein